MKKGSIGSSDFFSSLGLYLEQEPIDRILEGEYVQLIHESLPNLRDKFKREYLEERVSNTQSGVLYSLYSDGLVGFFSFLDEGKPKTIYAWIGVLSPNYRNKGITKFVLDAVSESFKMEGYATIEVKTHRKNNPAIINLLKSGFYLDAVEEGLAYLSKSL